jgi:hypothetical protein
MIIAIIFTALAFIAFTATRKLLVHFSQVKTVEIKSFERAYLLFIKAKAEFTDDHNGNIKTYFRTFSSYISKSSNQQEVLGTLSLPCQVKCYVLKLPLGFYKIVHPSDSFKKSLDRQFIFLIPIILFSIFYSLFQVFGYANPFDKQNFPNSLLPILEKACLDDLDPEACNARDLLRQELLLSPSATDSDMSNPKDS